MLVLCIGIIILFVNLEIDLGVSFLSEEVKERNDKGLIARWENVGYVSQE